MDESSKHTSRTDSLRSTNTTIPGASEDMATLDALDASKVFYWNTSILVPKAWHMHGKENNPLCRM